MSVTLDSRPANIIPVEPEKTNGCITGSVRWLKASGKCQSLRKILAVGIAILLTLTVIGIPVVLLAAKEWKKQSIDRAKNGVYVIAQKTLQKIKSESVDDAKDEVRYVIPQATLQNINTEFQKAEPSFQELNQFLDEKDPSLQQARDLIILNREQLDDLLKISRENVLKRHQLLNDVHGCTAMLDAQFKIIALQRGNRAIDQTENELRTQLKTLKEKFAPIEQKAENQIKLEKVQIEDIFNRINSLINQAIEPAVEQEKQQPEPQLLKLHVPDKTIFERALNNRIDENQKRRDKIIERILDAKNSTELDELKKELKELTESMGVSEK